MTPEPRELKRRCDFVALVLRYTRLRRAGSQFVGLCPFHRDSDPSLYIEPERRIWKCFGCDRGGDIFDFVMLAEGCDFSRALRIVSDFVLGVAGRSEPRSGERFESGVGAKPLAAREAGGSASQKQSEHARLVSKLDATERRNAGIARTNAAALAELATACEPSEGGFLLLVSNRVTGRKRFLDSLSQLAATGASNE